MSGKWVSVVLLLLCVAQIFPALGNDSLDILEFDLHLGHELNGIVKRLVGFMKTQTEEIGKLQTQVRNLRRGFKFEKHRREGMEEYLKHIKKQTTPHKAKTRVEKSCCRAAEVKGDNSVPYIPNKKCVHNGESRQLSAFTCNRGYKFSNTAITCNNGVFTPTLTCSRVECEISFIQNGRVNEGDVGEILDFDSAMTVTCDAGYYVTTPNPVKCDVGVVLPSCLPTECEISFIQNGRVSEGGVGEILNFDSAMTVSCDAGYEVTTPNPVKCDVGVVLPSCLPIECEISFIQNGRVNEGDVGEILNFDSAMTVSCDAGYEVTTPNPVKCDADVVLPSCLPIKCEISYIQNGRVNEGGVGEILDFGSVMTVSCDVGYEATQPNPVKCDVGVNLPSCLPRCCRVTEVKGDNSVPYIPSLSCVPHGDSQLSSSFVCNRGYNLSNPAVNVTCNYGIFTPSVTCSRVECEISYIRNGRVSEGGVGEIVDFDSAMTVSCDSGYEVTTPNPVKCDIGVVLPSCLPKTSFHCTTSGKRKPMQKACNGRNDCGEALDRVECEISFIHNGRVNEGGVGGILGFDSPMTVTCDAGYEVTHPNPVKCDVGLVLPCCLPQTSFRCTTSGKHIPMQKACNGRDDCGDNSDEELGCDVKPCPGEYFRCRTGRKCIPVRWTCNGRDNCDDSSDEDENYCQTRSCPAGYFTCRNSRRCIPLHWTCDGFDSCGDNSDEDENYCETRSCPAGYFTCRNSRRCIPIRWTCNGVDSCGDNSDEDENYCETRSCPAGHFACRNSGRCMPIHWTCDGRDNCGDNSDEDVAYCETRPCPDGYVLCKGSRRCGWLRNICRGYDRNCRDKSDEEVDCDARVEW